MEQERLRKEMEAKKLKELEAQRLREEQEKIAKEKQAAVAAPPLNVTVDIQVWEDVIGQSTAHLL